MRSNYIRLGQCDIEARSSALNALAAKGVTVSMPDGRSTRGPLTKAKPGVACLAAQANVPAVPIAIYGHEQVYRSLPTRVPVQFRIDKQ